MLKDQSQPDMLSASPARGLLACPLPYMEQCYPRTQSLYPLRSLGRLLSDSAAPFLSHGVSGFPYLGQLGPGQAEELAGATEAAAGPLSSSFGSPSSGSSPSAASLPACKALFRTPSADTKPRSFSFSEDDLFMVLYGYSGNPERSAGLAVSGLTLPENSSAPEPRISPLEKESLDLPPGLVVLQAAWGNALQCGVFTDKRSLPKGARFGPFKGKLVNTSEMKTYDDNTLMWEVFENGRLSHFVDGRGVSGNWMSLVKCARFPEEQNLVAVQIQGQIFYEACKEIAPGQELLVWYGDCYAQFLGIPLTLKEPTEDGNAITPTEDAGDGFKCDRCGKVFAYKYYRDKHLKYTRCVDQGDRKFPCHLCSRSFEKRDRLRIHILHVHEKHRPHKCSECGKSFSQSSSLNKHMRVHSGERPYKCVYCNKAFTASSILRTHIRQHSGERPFKCKHCGKAFASHAAHDSHVRRTHARDKPLSCELCGACFQEEPELKKHQKTHKRRPAEATPSPPGGVSGDCGPPNPQKMAGQRLNYAGFTPLSYRPWK